MERALTAMRRERMEQVLLRRQKDLALVLANIHDPHNVSAIYRSCDAFGVPLVHLYYTTASFPALGEKTSASARKWVDSRRHGSKESLIDALRQAGQQILAASCAPGSRAASACDLTRPTAIIMGNEHAGVPDELLRLADGDIHIPMYGMIQSFNVSVAAALLLSEASRQRLLAGMYERSGWSGAEYAERLAAWLDK